MNRARQRVALTALALLLACGEDRATPLRAEIAKLEKERVPTEQLEIGKREALEAEAARDAAIARANEDDAALASARAELDRLRAALEREAERNAELRLQIDSQREPLAAQAAQVDALQLQVNERIKRLDVLRDQANALAAALRPDDPAWAESRRLAALHEFERAVREQLPAEPALGALSRALAAAPPEPAALVAALRGLADAIGRTAHASDASAGAQ